MARRGNFLWKFPLLPPLGICKDMNIQPPLPSPLGKYKEWVVNKQGVRKPPLLTSPKGTGARPEYLQPFVQRKRGGQQMELKIQKPSLTQRVLHLRCIGMCIHSGSFWIFCKKMRHVAARVGCLDTHSVQKFPKEQCCTPEGEADATSRGM